MGKVAEHLKQSFVEADFLRAHKDISGRACLILKDQVVADIQQRLYRVVVLSFQVLEG